MTHQQRSDSSRPELPPRIAWFLLYLSLAASGAGAGEIIPQRAQDPPVDLPPVAQLALALTTTPLTLKASGASSTDLDATRIASYRFDFGDSTPAVVTTAPTSIVLHTYAVAGTYKVTLTVTDTGNLTSMPVSQWIAVSSGPLPVSDAVVAVYVGYYDTHHQGRPQPKPSPWRGSPGVVFVGAPDSLQGGWDTSAVRVDNLTDEEISSVVVEVDIGAHHYALWGTRSIPAGGTLILAQMGLATFDGSDTNPAGCLSCDPSLCLTAVQSTVPVVHVSIDGTTTNYFDIGQVLNTHGVDSAGCPYTGKRNDETEAWTLVLATPLASPAPGANVLSLQPPGSPGAQAIALAPPAPNPASGVLFMRFGLASSATVRLMLYDVGGRLVKECLNQEMESGQYQKAVDLAGIRAGVYFAELRTPTSVARRSFVISR